MISWVRKFPWRKDRLPIPGFLGFPGGSDGKESTCDAGDLDLIPGLGRSPRERKGYPRQYSCLENPMDRRAWRAAVHGVTKSWTRLSDLTLFFFLKLYFPGGSDGKEPVCNAGDPGNPGSERSPGGGNGNPLQYSCPENPTDRGAWWATVHGVTELNITE